MQVMVYEWDPVTETYSPSIGDIDMAQTGGTFPQIHGNANYGKSGSAKTTKGGKGKKH